MNSVLHLKYALEVEKAQSISKAAENLYMNQPHLSKAIKELEVSLGIKIFNRTSKGVIPTKKGEEFLIYAKNIILQIDEMEALYRPTNGNCQKFDISVPRASYISFAFTEFIKELNLDNNININYCETNSEKAISNVAECVNNLAIVRYQTIYERYFLNAILDRKLNYESIWEFEYLALMSKLHPLANKKIIDYKNLCKYIELVHGDFSIPTLPITEAQKLAKYNECKKKISVYERGSQFELLSRIPSTYIWVSPMPEDVLNCFSLVQKSCNMSKNKYKDIIIYRQGYKLSSDDKLFIKKLKQTVNLVSKY